MSHRRREMYITDARLRVCLSIAAFQHYCTDPGVTWGVSSSSALLGGFAIGARVSLL